MRINCQVHRCVAPHSTNWSTTMNIFASISTILAALTGTTVKACTALDHAVEAVDNVALMAKQTTQSMLNEQQEEANQALAALKAKASA